MKKIIGLFVLTLFCTQLLGCYTNSFSIQQSNDNFQMYFNAIQQVAEEYGLKLTEEINHTAERQQPYKDLHIGITSNAFIKIRMINSAVETDKGSESFTVDYFLYNSDLIPETDVKLFVALVNCISGKKVSYDFCCSFLSAPESEYAASDYGYQKKDGELVAKMFPMNFFEDWVLCYFETLERKQMSFGGLTKS